jgi:Fe-S oxidoreductase
LTVSVHDSCSFRRKPQVHAAVRRLLGKMKISVREAELSGTRSVCCGDNFYAHVPNERVVEFQKTRAAQMPCEDVAVYCVSCIKSMAVGGKRPRHMVDLVLGEETVPGGTDLDAWHAELARYIDAH